MGTIKVHKEPKEFKYWEAEDCVDCHKPTRYWLNPHIPLCEECAEKRNSTDDLIWGDAAAAVCEASEREC